MKFFTYILLFVLPFTTFAYEPTQTHASLTDQVVEFYNIKSVKKISSTDKELIINGAVDEDNPASRALNHFYDPVRNIGIEGGRTAKDWATIDTVANDYSWKKTIVAYARGDMQTAFAGLGHILHLVEDMGVPDHTRNDQHLPFLDQNMGGHSPYEDWGMKNKNRQTMQGFALELAESGVTPKLFPNVGEYFDFLASYSNKSFFSRDTIYSEDIYQEPKILKYSEGYGYGTDKILDEQVVLVKKSENQGVIVDVLSDSDDSSILSSYFSRLSRQIIPSGAGVIELFFNEGEKARVLYNAELLKRQQADAQANAEIAQSISQKGFIGLVWSGAVFIVQDNLLSPFKRYVLRPIGSGLAFAGSFVTQEGTVAVNIGQFATVATAGAVKDTAVAGGNYVARKAGEGLTIIQQTATDLLNTPVNPQSQMLGPTFAVSDSISPQPQTVFIFEPKVQAGTNAPKLVFVGAFVGGATSQVLGSQTSTSGVEEIIVVEEAIEATGAALAAPALSAPQCAQTLATDGCLLATTTVRFEWPAVEGADHYLINKNGEFATTTDSSHDITIKDFSDYTFEVVAIDSEGNPSATSTQAVSVATIPIAINEIAWMGTVASPNDEWFEIKNNTSRTIDLSQWELNAKDGTPHVKLAGTIKPHEYLIFERTDNSVVKDVEAHATTTGALNNSGEQLTLSHDAVVFDQTPDGEWVAGATSTRQTMERYSSREPGTDPENWSTNLGDTRTQQERYDCYRKLDKQFKDTRECFTKGFIKNGTDADGNAIGGTPGAQNSISTLVNKGQNITEDFTLTADEEVYVIPDGGNVYVDASSTLTIEPGVTISFYGGQWDEKQIIIEGTLDAKGTSENPIVFNSFFPNNQIGGIHFSAGASTSTMSYVRMESTNGIMLTDGAKLSIQDSQFVDNYSGVESDGKNTVTIENTNFKNTEEEPVWAYNGGFVSIASSTIIDTIDGAAIDVSDGVTLNVGSTIIDGAYDWANAGIEAYGSNVSITNSTIRNTIAEGVSAYSSNVLIASSTVSDTMENGMYLYNSSSTIINSTIEDVVGWSGVSAEGGTILIASSTIKNVLNDGIGLYDSISTISNTVIKDGTGDGIEVQGGTATITNATVSGFAGSGILTSSFVEDVFTDDGSYSGLWTIVTSTVESIVITGGEVAGNAVGVDVSSADSAIISDVYIHDNGTSEADNIVGYP
ncbi:MAG: Polymorphic membrane protein [Parcubacteria group bacterium GW2011_GWA1_44_13]|uniref:Polymorphic membrane protein n=1 Tax=Candidatus Nomurabacteria bacterium GW2011_GWB1_44_12 TaxID=1618748 RepID=A0A837IAM7_9BACT|nr:MAG: Polymorphic membrane protein [Candidatus Nomurabacteria bacterium GW2011_GWB1_44_12]KKT37622.1 MAG: Polymorphic membrane protein [Parcubacteria group bacterium GW2011_GWA1_44_13]HBB44152.1 hypothetical protein [Candidatus Yonathbacteria bacterium]